MSAVRSSIPCTAYTNIWNQLPFNEGLGLESLISSNCFECSSDTEEVEFQPSLCEDGLLTPLPGGIKW